MTVNGGYFADFGEALAKFVAKNAKTAGKKATTAVATVGKEQATEELSRLFVKLATRDSFVKAFKNIV